MSIQSWVAIAVTLVTVWALIKRYETRLVLLAAGLFLCCISLDPMYGLDAMGKSMTNKSLIMAICGSMGFAFVASYTQCDRSLVHYLASPIRGLGIFLLPVCTTITFFINIAIPSAAGCAAAVGSYLSPGTSHNVFVANMAKMSEMDFIAYHSTFSLMCGAILIVGIALVAFILGDHKGDKNAQVDESKLQKMDFVPSPLKAIVPFVPIAILVLGNTCLPAIKMGVAQAMLIGAIAALVIARANPQQLTKEFFSGMGKGYADVMGIIIAAGVFAAGLRATGLIDAAVAALKDSNEFARWGGSLGPWIMGVITGSGDAATQAFNEAVTPHAESFGMTIPGLGGLAFLTGALGRTMSPLAGVTILVSGIAMVSPIEVIKRTAVPCIVAVVACALLMV